MYGGVNAPYIWLKTPGGLSSWEFFDKLLSECNVVGTPGSGFGPSGEGFFRLSAFGSRDNVTEAVGEDPETLLIPDMVGAPARCAHGAAGAPTAAIPSR